MSKVLSVCVPSYNMEKYLNRCIDSFLVPEVLDRLELIIVNDGSTDETLSIANDYKARYPQTIVVIDKPNGHYGSCVNASLKIATGKYFRIVDADDWVDSNALVTFINKLETIDVDCVCTKYTVHNFKSDTIKTEVHEAPFDRYLDLEFFKLPESCFFMHVLTYSTELLHRIDYIQSEGICYTDTEYSYMPLACSKNIYFVNLSLYQYFYGRDDQSMSAVVLQKNLNHILGTLQKIQSVHLRHDSSQFNQNEGSIYSALAGRLIDMAVPVYLQYFNYNKTIDVFLKQSISSLCKTNRRDYHGFRDYTLCRVPYVSLWYKSRGHSKYIMLMTKLLRKSIDFYNSNFSH